MKIVETANLGVRFGDLKLGEVFMHADHYYMKCETANDCNQDKCNCVSVNTGSLAYLYDTDVVHKVECTLVVGSTREEETA